jgi:molecular chaperone HscA
MILAAQSALAADADLLSPNERAQIDSLIVGLADTRAHGDAAAIEAATQALAKGTEGFAAQRMNRGIKQALAGKNIEAV